MKSTSILTRHRPSGGVTKKSARTEPFHIFVEWPQRMDVHANAPNRIVGFIKPVLTKNRHK